MTAKPQNAAPPSEFFRLLLLGGFALLGPDGREIAVSSKKNRALLAILALSPRLAASRDRVAELLWGDHGEEQARASLRQSLASLRRDIGPADSGRLLSQDDIIALDPSALRCDALEVLAATRSDDMATLRAAARNWGGGLLADLILRQEGFDDWLAGERSRLEAAALEVFARLCDVETGAAKVEAARRLVALDPLRESSHRSLMRAHAQAGDRALAVKQYDACRALLQSELQIEPAAETRAVRDQISGMDSETPAPAMASLDDRPCLAVLPLENADPSAEQAFLSDGITEDLIAALCRFRRFTVISKASSFAYRGRSAGLKEIGAWLGAQFIVRGSLRLAGQRIRVTAELADAQSEATLWSDKLDHPLDDVFDAIDDLSRDIAVAVVGRLEDEVLRRARRRSTSSFSAYELVLRGRALLQSPDRSDQLAARDLFEQAIRLEPTFAHAQVQLALSHLQQFFFDDSGEALDRANAIAADALLIDEEEPWCHMILGLTHLHRRRFDLAVTHCLRSAALNPNDPGLLARLGLVLTDAGRPEEAIACIQKAMSLNPLNPQKYSDYMALALFAARRYGESRSVLETMPDGLFYTHVWLAAVLIHLGDRAAAQAHAGRAMALAPDFSVGRFARMEPIQLPDDLARWTDALAAAGFPA